MTDDTTPPPVLHVDWKRLRENLRLHRTAIRRGVLAGLAFAVIGIPLFGWSDELLAFTGERFFGVADLPPTVAPDERTTVHDATGAVIGVISGAENRRSVALDDVPNVLRKAIIASEDTRFWQHEGVDVGGILRAAFVNATNLSVSQGGSTITQQYIKNALLSPERSMSRKITEATWAVRIEQVLTKEEILERYLNLVYLGDGNYGVAAASEYWFDLPVQELDLSRSALIAAMIKAPETFDPATNAEAAGAARDRVLDRMLDLEWITPVEASDAKAVLLANQIHVTPLPDPERPLFVEFVKQQLLERPELGATREERIARLFGGGLQVHTTLDTRLQAHAEASLAGHLRDPLADPMGGIVSVQPGDGGIRAMALGPKGFGPCDAAPDACATTSVNPLAPGLGSPGRQVGSAFKPIVVAAALEAGLDADWHTPTPSGEALEACDGYAPENYSDQGAGTIDMVEALRSSNNVFHVKLGVATGLERVADLGSRLGLGALAPWCSLPLGSAELHPVDLASAYAAFAAHGIWCAPYAVTEVRDIGGEILLRTEPDCSRAMDAEVADTVTSMLQVVVREGTAKGAAIGRPAAAKTGTTNDYRDAWLVGFTPQLATAVWLGFEQPEPMRGILGVDAVSGGSVPADIWAQFMAAAHEPWEVQDLASVDVPRFTCSAATDADSFSDGSQPCESGDKGNGGKGRKKKGRKD